MTPAEVRQHFSGYPFGEPCNPDEIRRAESFLGQPIPQVLRELYLSFNGFLGPTSANFFWPLFEQQPGRSALVDTNRFLRDDDVFPRELMSQCLFYGDAGIGSQWGLRNDMPGKIIRWHAGEDFEIVGTDVLQVWLDAKRMYDELPSQ